MKLSVDNLEKTLESEFQSDSIRFRHIKIDSNVSETRNDKRKKEIPTLGGKSNT